MSIHHQDDETRVRYKASWRSLFWVLVLASLIRCLFLVATQDHLDRDPDAYRKLAGNVLETGVYGWKTGKIGVGTNASADKVRPTAFRPPLYPALLICVGGVGTNWRIAVLHFVLGVATTGLVACLGWRAGLKRWAVAAAMLVALDPILLNQSALVMTETLATFLAALTLFCLTAKASSKSRFWSATSSSAVTGIVLGLCVLCRPIFLPWLGLIVLARVSHWISIRSGASLAAATTASDVSVGSSTAQHRLVHVAVLVGTALLVMAPWVIRNQMILGKAKLTTTHGGYTLLLGNNPLFYRFLKSGEHGTWDGAQLGRAWHGRSLTTGPDDDQWSDLPKLARRAEQQPTTDAVFELDDDRLAYALARRYIREQPKMFVLASGLRIVRLWRLVPHRIGETETTLRMMLRYLVGAWYAIVLGLAIFGLVNLGRGILAAPWLFGVQLCLVFTGVHAIYWSDMRMRAPLVPFISLVAASGMAAILGHHMNRKS